MKRLTVVLVGVLCALALSPSTAQAADPVAVLRAQLVKNRGVTIVERSIEKEGDRAQGEDCRAAGPVRSGRI